MLRPKTFYPRCSGRKGGTSTRTASAPHPRLRDGLSCLPRPAKIGDVFSQSCSQIDLVVLLVHQNLPDLLGHGKLAQRFALTHPLTVIADGLVFVLQIKA